MSVDSAKKALKELSFALQIDPDLAWSWHCNIAMVAQDAGAPHKEANERTADFMRRAFDVDTTRPPIHPVNELELLREKYNELLYAVGKKYTGETRHQTALRYIQQAEASKLDDPQCGANNGEDSTFDSKGTTL